MEGGYFHICNAIVTSGAGIITCMYTTDISTGQHRYSNQVLFECGVLSYRLLDTISYLSYLKKDSWLTSAK